MTREGPTGVGSVPGSPTSTGIMYRGRGMTSLDPDIDGGLPWFRGVVPAAGTRPGTKQEPAQEPAPKPPGARGGSDPAPNLGTDSTEEKRHAAEHVGRRSQEGWLKSLFWKERRACAHLRSLLVSICFGEASCLLGFKWCAPGPTRRLERPTQWKWPNTCVAQIITRIPFPLGLPARGKTP